MPTKLLLVLTLLLTTACNTTPRQQHSVAQEAYIGVVSTLLQARSSIGEEKWAEEVVPLVNAGDRLLDLHATLTDTSAVPKDGDGRTLSDIVGLLQALSVLTPTSEGEPRGP